MPYSLGEVEPVLHTGEGHLLTIAPTGAGKGVRALIPNLLNYTGSAVVVDPKGELFNVTAKRRRSLGQRIVVLDPLNQVSAGKSDALNPLDMIWQRDDILLEDEAQKFAELIAGGPTIAKDPFWDHWGHAILKAEILALELTKKEERHLGRIYDSMHCDDKVYQDAVMLDTKKKTLNKTAYQEKASFIQLADITRSGVLSTAQQYMKKFATPQIRSVLERTTFPVNDLIEGKPMTIYMVIPPEYLKSHGSVLRLWMTTIMKLLFSRRKRPRDHTLLMIDEAAQLGYMEDLEVAMTLGRGYGIQVWSFWQSAAQLRRLYPASWETLLDNVTTFQLFGARNYRLCREFASLTGFEPEDVAALSPEEQLLVQHGKVRRCWLPNYLRDPAYEGLYSANPFYGKHQQQIV